MPEISENFDNNDNHRNSILKYVNTAPWDPLSEEEEDYLNYPKSKYIFLRDDEDDRKAFIEHFAMYVHNEMIDETKAPWEDEKCAALFQEPHEGEEWYLYKDMWRMTRQGQQEVTGANDYKKELFEAEEEEVRKL